MIKAVFLDYTGTITKEGGPDLEELVGRVCKNSNLHDPRKVVTLWWEWLKDYEDASYGENYKTEDEIVNCLLSKLEEEYGLTENRQELLTLIHRFWIYAPIFEDIQEFFKRCPLPIYIISNNGNQYVGACMKEHNLTPTDIISGDMVKAYKPHKELFSKALEVSGFEADEVIHIGDSYFSDVKGATAAGIKAVLLNRKKKEVAEGVTEVSSLLEVLNLIR